MPRRRLKLVSYHLLIYSLILILLAGLAIFNYLRPLPPIYPTIYTVTSPTTTANPLIWPNSKAAAVGAVGFGVLSTYGTQTQLPIASVAKIITALTVLQKYPLSPNQQQTPIITMTDADVAIYNQYVTEQGSVVKVVPGEQISEYQALEAMLMPSANNMADSLAIWAFGSLPDYSIAANQYIKSIGLDQTTVGVDASGFLPSTTSTAHDLILLGLQALNSPVIAQIVDQTQANLPIVGIIKNVNWLLGNDGIIGIKTGNTSQAGGVYLFAANDKLSGSTSNIEIIGSIVGTTIFQDAINDCLPLLNSTKLNFYSATIIKRHEIVGAYKVPWGAMVPAISLNNISSPLWRGTKTPIITSLQAIYAPVSTTSTVGVVEVSGQFSNPKTDIVLQKPISMAPWWWRIIRHKL
jgi:D-alanyl-D-alanine carboxypeptidase (penicillin-binding protein 5/6)